VAGSCECDKEPSVSVKLSASSHYYSNYFTYVFNILFFYFCVLVLYVCFLFCVFGVFVLFCVLFLLLYIAVSFLFVHQHTDHCHQAETRLKSTNIIFLDWLST
jgi:hypothetical protein